MEKTHRRMAVQPRPKRRTARRCEAETAKKMTPAFCHQVPYACSVLPWKSEPQTNDQ